MFIERYVLVMPSFLARPVLGLPEIVTTLGFAGVFGMSWKAVKDWRKKREN